MSYSLLSQFQACLLGMSWAEAMHGYWNTALQHAGSSHSSQPADLRHWHPQPTRLHPPVGFSWSAFVQRYADSIVRSQGHSLSLPLHSAPPSLDSHGLIVATLPLALLFHDNERQRRQALEQALADWPCDDVTYGVILGFGAAIAQALRGQIYTRTGLSDLLSYLSSVSHRPMQPLIDGLEQLQQGYGWSALERQLHQQTTSDTVHLLVLGLHCVVETPYDLRLTLMRTIRLGHLYPLIGPLVGALAGAAMGWNGIPLGWRIHAIVQPPSKNADSHPPLQQTAQNLLALWSGAYQLPDDLLLPAIAAPPGLS